MTAASQSPLTEAHVEEALKTDKGTDAKLISWSIHDFIEAGTNYITNVVCIKVKYSQHDRQDVASYILKYNPNRGENWTQFMRLTFDKEIRFFKVLGPELSSKLKEADGKGLMIPKCVLTRSNNPEMIIQVDLREVGYKMHDRKLGMDEAHVILVLKEMARLHASSVLLKSNGKEPLQEKYDFLRYHWSNFQKGAELGFQAVTGGYLENARLVLERIPGRDAAAEWTMKLKLEVLETFSKLTALDSKFAVVCHFDLINNNLLFRYDEDGNPTDVMLLDFQMCYVSSLANDLTEFLLTCLDGPRRTKGLQRFLETYYNAFQKVVIASGMTMSFTLEELQKEYKSKLVFGALAAIGKVQYLIAETEEIPDMEIIDEVENFLNAQQKNLLIMLRKYPNFSSRFLSVFDDLQDNGIF